MNPRLRLDGPTLMFGGPYSNLEATRAVLAEARRRQIPPERVICTGDVVAYGADGNATVDLIRSAGIHVVAGNCEEALARRARDCGCGFAQGSSFFVAPIGLEGEFSIFVANKSLLFMARSDGSILSARAMTSGEPARSSRSRSRSTRVSTASEWANLSRPSGSTEIG